MKIEFEDQVWDLDLTHVTYKQAYAIQLFTGMSIGEWEDSIEVGEDEDGNPVNPPPEWVKSIGALYWLMRSQGGDKIAFDDMDFEFGPFLVAVMEGMAAELERVKAERRDEPDPTSPPRSRKAAPRSAARGSRTATTRRPRARQEGEPATVSGEAGT